MSDPITIEIRRALATKLGAGLVLGRPMAVDTEQVGRALEAAAEAARAKAVELGHSEMTLAEARAEIERLKADKAAMASERDTAIQALAVERAAKGG